SQSHTDFRNNKWRNGLLKTKISKFKPFRDIPERFLTQVEWELELNEVPKSEWVSAFKYFLDPNNGSFLWYQSYLTDFENNWKLFAEIFRNNYSLYHNIDQKRKEFYELKYNFGQTVTFHDYFWKVHRLAKELNPLASFADIKDRIENSVPYSLRNAMMSVQPANEDALIKLGCRIENDMNSKIRSYRGKQFDSKAFESDMIFENENYEVPYNCENCEQEEIDLHAMNVGQNQFNDGRPQWYNNRNNFGNDQRRYADRQQGQCYKCHQRGHMIAKCPLNDGQAVLTKDNVNVAKPSENSNGKTN